MASLETVPPEILCLIFSSLYKSDLRDLRQVSKHLDQATVPYLFDRVFFSYRIEDLRIAKAVISRFGQHIKSLTFSSVTYKALRQHEYAELFYADPFFSVHHQGLRDAAIEKRYKNYQKACSDQRECMQKTTFEYLSYAFTAIPGLRRVLILDAVSERSMPSKSMLEWVNGPTNAHCLSEDCVNSIGHLPRFHRKYPALECRLIHREGNPWRPLLQAISNSNSSLTEISVWGNPTNTRAFDEFPVDSPGALRCLETLKKLSVTVLLETDNPRRVNQVFKKFLTGARGLDSLELEASDFTFAHREGDMTAFEAILGGCEFPQLKNLILHDFDSTEDELLDFLKGLARIEQLHLVWLHFQQGSWRTVVDYVDGRFPNEYFRSYTTGNRCHLVLGTDWNIFDTPGRPDPPFIPGESAVYP